MLKVKTSLNINCLVLLCTISSFVLVLVSSHMQLRSPARGPERATLNNLNYTFAAAILRDDKFISTGTIISDSLIVTAASPFIDSEPSSLRVRLGSVNRNHGGMLLPARSIHSHPNYTHNYPEFDVALIRLATTVPLSGNLRSVNSAASASKCPPKFYRVTHWIPDHFHPKERNGNENINLLRLTYYKAAGRKKCREDLLSHNITLTRNIMCLSPNIGNYKCIRDIGAPVLGARSRKAELWSVISEWKSADCSTHPSPILATRLTADIKKWIETIKQINVENNATAKTVTVTDICFNENCDSRALPQ